MNNNDMKLKEAVEAELLSDPKVDAAHIIVDIKNGAVSLTGSVENDSEKYASEDAAKRVRHVRSVDVHLIVSTSPATTRAPMPSAS